VKTYDHVGEKLSEGNVYVFFFCSVEYDTYVPKGEKILFRVGFVILDLK